MTRYKGYTGSITIEGDSLTLARDTAAGKMTFGKAEPRLIPLAAISGVGFRPATILTNGAIKLLLGGDTDDTLGKVQALVEDPDAVLFTAQQRKDFEALREYLAGVAAQNQAAGAGFAEAPEGQASVANRLAAKTEAKLATLDAKMVAFDAKSATRKADEQALAAGRVEDMSEAAQKMIGARAARFEGMGVRQDIAAAASRLGWTFGGKREIKNLESHLFPDETVEFLAQGTYEGNQGIIALTGYRLLFLFHGLANKRTEDFPISNVSSVQVKSGFGISELRIYASGNKATIASVVDADARAISDAMRMKIMQSKSPTRAGGPTPAPDPMAQLEKLASLHVAGILTDEEFAAKKADLLDRM